MHTPVNPTGIHQEFVFTTPIGFLPTGWPSSPRQQSQWDCKLFKLSADLNIYDIVHIQIKVFSLYDFYMINDAYCGFFSTLFYSVQYNDQK